MTELQRIQTERRLRPFYKDYESFYQAYYGRVLGYLKNRANSYVDAEDVAAKVFLYCYERWDSYDPQKASQQTWLFTIVRSRWIDFLRNSKSYDNIDEIDEFLVADDNLLDNAIQLQTIRKELADALKRLPENQQRAIIMRYFGDSSDSEIAQCLNTTTGNVRVLIHRGMSKLKLDESLIELQKK